MFKFCVVALVLAVAAMSVNGYHYYPGYVGGLERGIYPPFAGVYPPLVDGKLVDGKFVEAKIEGVAGVSYLNYPRSYYPYNYGYSYGYPYGPGLRIVRDAEEPKLEELKKVEN